MEPKFVILKILDVLGLGWGTLSIFTVINNTKEAILFIIGLLYAGVRLYFSIRFNQNRDRRERFEQQQREKGINGHYQKR